MKKFKTLFLLLPGILLLASCASAPKVYTIRELALLNALKYPDSSKLHKVLSKKVDPNLCDREGTPVLMMAAVLRKYDACEMLLKAGADPNLPDADGDVPLHTAAGSLSSDILTLLLKYGAHPEISDKRGITPLMESARLGRVENARILLEHGASLSSVDFEGRTVMTFAALAPENGIPMIKLLLKQGFTPPGVVLPNNPLLTALDARHTETAHYLLSLIAGHKIDNPQEIVLSLAAARLAILNNDLISIKYLTEMGMPMNMDLATGFKAMRVLNMEGVYKFSVRNRMIETNFPPLIWAALYGRPEIASYLVLHGADPNKLTDEGQCAYDYANDRATSQAIRKAEKEYKVRMKLTGNRDKNKR